jgi:hypothetical protein
MSKARPSINIKIQAGLLDRVAAICTELEITRNQFVNLAIEHACLSQEQRHEPIKVRRQDQAALPGTPILAEGPGRVERVATEEHMKAWADGHLDHPGEQPAAAPSPPQIVTDAEGNQFVLQPMSSEQRSGLKVTGQDAETLLRESVDRATGEAVTDAKAREDAYETGIAMAKITAENMPPGPAREQLEMEGNLHIHTYVPIPGTRQVLNAEPYQGQVVQTFRCDTCQTTSVRPLE